MSTLSLNLHQQAADTTTGDMLTLNNSTQGGSLFTNQFSRLSVRYGRIEEAETEESCAKESSEKNMSGSRGLDAKPEANYSLNIEPESEYAEEDIIPAAQSLYNNLGELRKHINKYWCLYRRGDCDLASVSILTNTIFNLARQEEYKFHKSFPAHQGFEGTRKLLFGTNAVDGTWDIWPSDPTSMLPHVILKSRYGLMHGEPNAYEVMDDEYQRREDQKYLEKKTILVKLFENYEFQDSYRYRMPAYDELTRAMRDVFLKQPPEIWTAFAAHITLDIHGTMGNEITRRFDDLRKIAADAAKSLRSKRKFMDTLKLTAGGTPKWWSKGGVDEASKWLLEEIETWILDNPAYPVVIQAQKAKAREQL